MFESPVADIPQLDLDRGLTLTRPNQVFIRTSPIGQLDGSAQSEDDGREDGRFSASVCSAEEVDPFFWSVDEVGVAHEIQ